MRTVRELQIEAGQWNEYHNGKPINAGCKVDCKTAEYGYPSMTLQEVATAYHDKGQPGFRAEFDGARNLLQVMLPKFPSIFPSSEVKFEQTNYVEQSYEVGFMTESDVARLLGYSPKDLKMGKGASLKLEDGSGRIQGWFCSLAGMSPEAAGSIRKIKVGSVISVKRDDVLMSKDTQLRTGQADEVMQMALQQSMESRYSAEKCIGRSHLTSFASLREKAERLKEAWCMKEREREKLRTSFISRFRFTMIHPAWSWSSIPSIQNRPAVSSNLIQLKPTFMVWKASLYFLVLINQFIILYYCVTVII